MDVTTIRQDKSEPPEGVHISVLDAPRGFLLLIHREHSIDNAGETFIGELWNSYREYLNNSLLKYGAILFRGFGICNQPALEFVVGQMQDQLLNYVDGNSPRTKLGSGIYTSTEYPPEFFISLHNELSYSARWPSRLFFCCVATADKGGETPLVDSRLLLRQLPKNLVEEFRNRQVKYIRHLHGGSGFGPSWQKTFETTNMKDVENYARWSGMDLQWNADGSLRLSCVRPATVFHPVSGDEAWFNQADQFHPSTHPESFYKSMMIMYKGREHLLPQNATFGDDTPIPLEYLETIRALTKDLIVLFQWQKGDLLMIDNMLTAHGRMPFKGPRRILVAMTAPN